MRSFASEHGDEPASEASHVREPGPLHQIAHGEGLEIDLAHPHVRGNDELPPVSGEREELIVRIALGHGELSFAVGEPFAPAGASDEPRFGPLRATWGRDGLRAQHEPEDTLRRVRVSSHACVTTR